MIHPYNIQDTKLMNSGKPGNKVKGKLQVNHSPQTMVVPDHSPLSLQTHTVEVALGW